MKQMIVGIATLLAGGGAVLWGVLSFTISGLRDDVSSIRTDIGKLQESSATAPTRLSEAQLALSKDISGLRVDIESFRGDFKVVRVSLDDIGAKIDSLVKQPSKDKK